MPDWNYPGLAVILATIAVFGWFFVDLPPLSRAVTVGLGLVAFLVSYAAIERLRARYLPDDAGE